MSDSAVTSRGPSAAGVREFVVRGRGSAIAIVSPTNARIAQEVSWWPRRWKPRATRRRWYGRENLVVVLLMIAKHRVDCTGLTREFTHKRYTKVDYIVRSTVHFGTPTAIEVTSGLIPTRHRHNGNRPATRLAVDRGARATARTSPEPA